MKTSSEFLSDDSKKKNIKYSKVLRDLSTKNLPVYCVKDAVRGKASFLGRTLIVAFTTIPFRYNHVSHFNMDPGRNIIDLKVFLP